MDPAIHRSFMALLEKEGLADPSWVLSLDDDDEPPLFTRDHQIEFLRPLPEEQRLIVTLEIVLSTIEKIADEAARGAPGQTFFVCATLHDFDQWRAGETLIPRPAIFVNPREAEVVRACPYVEPWREEALLIARALTALGPSYADRYCVGDLSAEFLDPDIDRVYLGWRVNPAVNVRSVGRELRRTASMVPST